MYKNSQWWVLSLHQLNWYLATITTYAHSIELCAGTINKSITIVKLIFVFS